MTYQEWCNNSKRIIEEADAFNQWRIAAKHNLLTNIGPELVKLEQSGYNGHGFHYGLEHTFGNLIVSLSLPWQPSANYCDRVEDQMHTNLITKVLYEDLLESVKNAHASISVKET